MNRFKQDEIVHAPEGVAETADDGIDRRNFLGCMAWAGTGLLWSMAGGVLTSKVLAQAMQGTGAAKAEEFSFVQISNSHIGLKKGANPGVTGTLKKAIDKIDKVPVA
jgi:hypothetical protein